MGAWGHGTFQNDDALDLLAELTDGGDVEVLDGAVGMALAAAAGYLEAPEASRALAAADVVAALAGRPAPDLPDEAIDWVGGRPAPGPDLVARSRQAVRAVLTDSELRELWEEADDLPGWQAVVEDLSVRLR